jgi:O-antigen/teichoic acid export membrane protein
MDDRVRGRRFRRVGLASAVGARAAVAALIMARVSLVGLVRPRFSWCRIRLPCCPRRRSPLSVTIPWLSATAVTPITGLVILRRMFRRIDWSPTGAGVTAVAASFAAHGGSVTRQLAYRADLFILGWFMSAAAVGLYTLSTAIVEVVWVVPEVLALSVFADEGVRAARCWKEVAGRRVRQAVTCSAMAVVAMLAGGAILLLHIPPDYRKSFVLLVLLLPGVLAGAAARVVLAAPTARNERSLLRRAAVSNLAIACLYLPAIALEGVTGAVIASTFVYLLQLLVAQQAIEASDSCMT